MPRVGPRQIAQERAILPSTVIFAAAGMTSGALMLVNRPHLPATGAGWAVIIAIVLIATVLPVAAFLAGLERIGPTNAAMLSTLEPVVTVLLATTWLDEVLQPVTWLGGGLILIAVLLLTRSELKSLV